MHDVGLLLTHYFSRRNNEQNFETNFITSPSKAYNIDEVLFKRSQIQDNKYEEYTFASIFHIDNRNRNFFMYELNRLSSNKGYLEYEGRLYQIKAHIVSSTEVEYLDDACVEEYTIRVCITLIGRLKNG